MANTPWEEKQKYFNPRSPHGERRFRALQGLAACDISIHAPRTGSDKKRNDLVARGLIFQSTLPARGATVPWRLRIAL